MTNSSRLTMIGLVAFGVLILAVGSPTQNRPPIIEQSPRPMALIS